MYQHKHRNTVNNTPHPRFTIGDYISEFKREKRQKWGRTYDTRHEGEILNIKEELSKSSNKQRVDYVSSNLNRGYIFYFICSGCGRRVKYLYEYDPLDSPLCRVCCKLGYKPYTEKSQKLSKIFRKPILSPDDKYMIIKLAGITKEDVLSTI